MSLEMWGNIPDRAKPQNAPEDPKTGVPRNINAKTGKLFALTDDDNLKLYQRLAAAHELQLSKSANEDPIDRYWQLETKDGKRVASLFSDHIDFPNPGDNPSDDQKKELEFIVKMVAEAMKGKVKKEAWIEGCSPATTTLMTALYEAEGITVVPKPGSTANQKNNPPPEESAAKLTF